MAPRQVGIYRLDLLLGSGGMGDVYKAFDTQRDRYVALKLLQEAFSDDREYLQRFQRESNVAARLRDPHVIPIHDFGEIDGQLFIDMRLVDGTDVAALLKENGRIAPQRAVYIVGQVAEALDAAHADNLVHRDIKPSNILVTLNDFVYVVDFGIARSTGGQETPLTITGTTVGTWNYMAPERFEGGAIDGRADVYSLACVLHECLTGRPPFADKDLPALMYAQLFSGPPQASGLVAGVPPALDEVIARGMAKDPRDRYPTAGMLAAAARVALLTGPPPAPMPDLHVAGLTSGPSSASPPATVADSVPGAPDPPVPEPEPAAADASTDQGGGRLPPGDVTAGPARGPAWRRLGVPLVVIAAAVAVPFWLVLAAGARSHAGGPPAAGKGSPTSPSQVRTASVPALALPTVAGKIPVGQTPNFVQVAPNGEFAYITNPGARAISVLNTVTDKVSAHAIPIPYGPPQSVSFSPDGRTAYVSVYGSNTSPLVAFIDTATGTVTGTVPVGNIQPGPSVESTDGRYLYVPNHNMVQGHPGDNVLDVIDLASKKVVGITVEANPHWVVLSKDGRFIYVTNHMVAHVTVLNARDDAVITEIGVGETPHSEALSPDGSRLAVTSYNGNAVFLINTATNQEIKPIPVGRLPLDIAYSPDGRYLFTVNNDDNTVTVIDTADYRVIGAIPTGKSPTSISVPPNGRQAYISDENDGTIEILNIPQ